ncbi:MAG TPA: DUF177 domain-containing protein [Polyangia bacterium]|jgi:uncharacterized protein
MFNFRIKDIPPEGLDREITLPATWFETTMAGVEGAWDQATGTVELNLSRHGAEDVLARGVVHTRVTVPCARCVEPAAVAIDADFAATFVPRGEARAEGAEDEPDVQTYTGEEIDVADLLREQILLGIPISTLCQPDCKGLCPQCGKDLNQGPCGCSAPADPRWAALAKLRTQ